METELLLGVAYLGGWLTAELRMRVDARALWRAVIAERSRTPEAGGEVAGARRD